jgi:diadenosine tetraphosphate (Ap4A) HIT family hydrolase
VTDCAFCRIIARESLADMEYEADAVLAFRDIYPKGKISSTATPKINSIDSLILPSS